MRRAILVLAVTAVALVVASGVALADNIEGNGADNRLVGTSGKDNISGGGGDDDVFGRGGSDRLFGDAGADDVYDGARGDRLHGGLGQDDLFGQAGDDFVNAIDGQVNDRGDCGTGTNDVAGLDAPVFIYGATDQISPNCEAVYVGIGPICTCNPLARSGSGADLSAIDTRKEAERAEADGLLRQLR